MTQEIKLKLILGNDLPVCDIVSSDPYVIFKANGKKYKSKVHANTCHPRWKQTFDIKASVNEEIKFELFDRDIIGKDDPMGECKWTVPHLPLNQKEYFLLKNSKTGYIVIRAVCTSGGFVPPVKQYADPNDRTVLKVEIDKIEGVGQTVMQSPDALAGLLKGVWKTSFGSYSAGVTKTTQMNYDLSVMGTRKYYIDARVNEDIEFELSYHNSKVMPFTKANYRVPDFHENEKTEFRLELKPFGQIVMKIKCKKSIWQNVQQPAIPPQFDYLTGPVFPVEVTVKTINQNPFIFTTLSDNAPYVTLKSGEEKKKTGCLYVYKSGEDRRRVTKWNQSFFMVAYVGQECKVKLKTIEQTIINTFKNKKTVSKGEFHWPTELQDPKGKKEIKVVLEKGAGEVELTIRRIRELSLTYRRYYLREPI